MNNISNNNKNTLCSYIISTNLTLYKKLIGSLMYLVNTRSDLSFVVNILSQFIVESKCVCWVVVKHVLIYLRKTIEYGLRYIYRDGVKLVGYSYAHWEGNTLNRKITSSCVFILGLGVISWFSRKKNPVALSSA
jgi:hypothetical protein